MKSRKWLEEEEDPTGRQRGGVATDEVRRRHGGLRANCYARPGANVFAVWFWYAVWFRDLTMRLAFSVAAGSSFSCSCWRLL